MTQKRRRLTLAERRAKVKAQQATNKQVLAGINAEITADKRKQENGRKIVAGAHLLEWIKDDAGLRTRLIDELAQSGRIRDRARFPEFFDQDGTRRPEALPSPPVPSSPPVPPSPARGRSRPAEDRR